VGFRRTGVMTILPACASTQVSKRGGFRYLIARRLGMYAGIDYAPSQDQHGYYIVVGNAWR
jgi:hypothetical protein